jgi:hypothetical protein
MSRFRHYTLRQLQVAAIGLSFTQGCPARPVPNEKRGSCGALTWLPNRQRDARTTFAIAAAGAVASIGLSRLGSYHICSSSPCSGARSRAASTSVTNSS